MVPKHYLMIGLLLGVNPECLSQKKTSYLHQEDLEVVQVKVPEEMEVEGQDYVRTARAKGLPEEQVHYKHALRNALLPFVTMFGLVLPGLIGGSVIIESIFAWPGIGRLAYEAILARDYPLIITVNFN